MQVTEAVQRRRSIKWFDPEHRMPEATFHTLMEHALLSPTAFNIQNWRWARYVDYPDYSKVRLPNSEDVGNTHFDIPVHPSLTEEDMNTIEGAIRSIMS